MKLFSIPFTLALILTFTFGCAPAGDKSGADTGEETKAPTVPAVVGKEISYNLDSLTMKGYIAYDENVEGKRPGVLVVHEWWGHNDYARMRADMLAKLGYVALAVDMYGDGQTADHPEDAGKFAGMVMSNMEGAKARFTKALETLQANPKCDSEKIAAIGYCFGGGVVLNMALQGVDLDGVGSFHGSLPTPKTVDGEQIKAAMLVCNGADDQFVPAEAIEIFQTKMKEAGVDLTFENYPGAVHSFTSPAADSLGKKFELPLAYNEEADTKSWAALEGFLKRIFE